MIGLMDIEFFNEKVKGVIEFQEKRVTTKTIRTLELLEKYGNRLGMPHSKKIDTNLFELRIRGDKEIRIIYCFHKNTIILLHAFIKKTQKIPKRIMQISRNRLNSLDNI